MHDRSHFSGNLPRDAETVDRQARPSAIPTARGRKSVGRFARELLPTSISYFASIRLKLIGKGAWRSALCPFHDDRVPSLRIKVESGAFRCMACGARGGDVLAFHRHRTGAGFAQAARDLGAWVDA